jgi:hypothetical protein
LSYSDFTTKITSSLFMSLPLLHWFCEYMLLFLYIMEDVVFEFYCEFLNWEFYTYILLLCLKKHM